MCEAERVTSPATPSPPLPPYWTATPPPPAAPPPPPTQPAGWYDDPWQPGHWRWYDGRSWTAHTNTPTQVQRRRLPSFLSVPVILAGIPSIALLGYSIVTNPLAAALGLVPLFIVGPVLIWMDRLEPEPWSSRLHTFLWGAFVAGFISLCVNTFVALATSETVAAVVSAPTIEELTKGAAIFWMVRRKEVDSIMDGLVYAGWSALGFAFVENISYFYLADEQDLLVETFVGRALFTPFAHPLFTAWIGLAIGIAVRSRRSMWTTLWGFLLAMGSHALWNGSLTLAESESAMIVTGVVVILFVLLFIATIVGVVILMRRERSRYQQLAPHIATRYGLPLERVVALLEPKQRRSTRQALPDKAAKQRFDAEAGAVARLAAMFDHPSAPAPDHEARLISQLATARRP